MVDPFLVGSTESSEDVARYRNDPVGRQVGPVFAYDLAQIAAGYEHHREPRGIREVANRLHDIGVQASDLDVMLALEALFQLQVSPVLLPEELQGIRIASVVLGFPHLGHPAARNLSNQFVTVDPIADFHGTIPDINLTTGLF